jgi:hypothetical protein
MDQVVWREQTPGHQFDLADADLLVTSLLELLVPDRYCLVDAVDTGLLVEMTDSKSTGSLSCV